MTDLERYGLEWTGPEDFVAKPMNDGYWTPWHIADARIKELEKQVEKLRAFIETAPVSTGVCMCGDDLKNHTLSDHLPVDQWDCHKESILNETSGE